MKKVYLLSGMIVLGITTSVNAMTMPKKGQSSTEDRQKLINQKIKALENRTPEYKRLDALLVEGKMMMEDTYQINNEPRVQIEPIVGYKLKNSINWSEVFRALDSMRYSVNVNEYLTPNILAINSFGGEYSLLDIAVEKNNYDAARTLLERYKANPNQGPVTALMQAERNGNKKMIDLLVKHGAK